MTLWQNAGQKVDLIHSLRYNKHLHTGIYMKKDKRARIAQTLQSGIPHLWDGRAREGAEVATYVCCAIELADIDYTAGIREAQDMISSRIRPYYTVYSWLESKGVKNITTKKLQAYRKKWMEQMVKEFSK